jgi:hypothetical protein
MTLTLTTYNGKIIKVNNAKAWKGNSPGFITVLLDNGIWEDFAYIINIKAS